jgi:hypothetical protein
VIDVAEIQMDGIQDIVGLINAQTERRGNQDPNNGKKRNEEKNVPVTFHRANSGSKVRFWTFYHMSRKNSAFFWKWDHASVPR